MKQSCGLVPSLFRNEHDVVKFLFLFIHPFIALAYAVKALVHPKVKDGMEGNDLHQWSPTCTHWDVALNAPLASHVVHGMRNSASPQTNVRAGAFWDFSRWLTFNVNCSILVDRRHSGRHLLELVAPNSDNSWMFGFKGKLKYSAPLCFKTWRSASFYATQKPVHSLIQASNASNNIKC